MGVSSILILLIGITTAWFEWKSEVDTNVTFNVSGLNITYEGEPTVIKGNLYPTMYMNNTDNIIHNFSLVTTSNIEIYSSLWSFRYLIASVFVSFTSKRKIE